MNQHAQAFETSEEALRYLANYLEQTSSYDWGRSEIATAIQPTLITYSATAIVVTLYRYDRASSPRGYWRSAGRRVIQVDSTSLLDSLKPEDPNKPEEPVTWRGPNLGWVCVCGRRDYGVVGVIVETTAHFQQLGDGNLVAVGHSRDIL